MASRGSFFDANVEVVPCQNPYKQSNHKMEKMCFVFEKKKKEKN